MAYVFVFFLQNFKNIFNYSNTTYSQSTVDTPTTMEHHDLGISPKLSALLAINYNQDSPTSAKKRNKPVISETAERERVEQAKIYFQRVFASSQQSEFDGLHSETDSKKTSSITRIPEKRDSIDQCYSAEISNQDERCQRELENVQFYHVNSDISDGSQCSIEPNSSLDVATGECTQKTDNEFAQNAFITDNSCNAVDNLINTSQTGGMAIGELSFGGIINSMSKSKSDDMKKKKEQQGLKMKLLENEKSQMHANEQSPDLFEESDDENDNDHPFRRSDVDDIKPCIDEVDGTNAMNCKRLHIFKSEKVILGQIQSSLAGLLPPPSVTILQYDILELLSAYKTNEPMKTFTSVN